MSTDSFESTVSARSTEGSVGAATPVRDIDPDLLRVIRRVAHREYLLPDERSARTSLTRPVRRRPVAESRAQRATRGTTARKVTRPR